MNRTKVNKTDAIHYTNIAIRRKKAQRVIWAKN